MKTARRLIVCLLVGAAMTVPAHAAETAQRADFARWLTAAVTERLTAELAGPGRTVGAVTVPLPVNYAPPADYDDLTVSLPYKDRLTDKIFVSVTLTKGDQPVSRLNLMATADIEADVLVATRDLTRGARVSAADVAAKRVKLDPATMGALFDPEAAVGKTLERNIREGTPLRETYLSSPKLVNDGDMVTVVATSGSLTVTTIAQAKEDGDRGQWIRVENTQSNKTFNARVVSPGRVVVEF
jgi:flagella basal body P-ring formation protein FlgA